MYSEKTPHGRVVKLHDQMITDNVLFYPKILASSSGDLPSLEAEGLMGAPFISNLVPHIGEDYHS